MQSFQLILGVTPFSQGGNKTNVLFAPLPKCGRAIRATSVASCYPLRKPAHKDKSAQTTTVYKIFKKLNKQKSGVENVLMV